MRYVTVEAPSDFAKDFQTYLDNGQAIDWFNEHIYETREGYKYFVPAILWPYIESTLLVKNTWTAESTKFVTSDRRKLLAEQGKKAITIAFQLEGTGNGWLSSAVDAAIDKVLQSQLVLVGLSGFIVRQAEILQKPYPG